MTERGSCLAYQEIRGLIESGVLQIPSSEATRTKPSLISDTRIQPASCDPIIGDTIYRLDPEEGLWKPEKGKTVWRSLLELPKKRREQVDISEGYEIKKGFTYLAPLEERIQLGPQIKLVKSSPKSSTGRVFLDTRLLADYQGCYDEISEPGPNSEHLQLWLLLQPLAFNHIIRPGLALNQLRFYQGIDSMLTSKEILKENESTPLLWEATPEMGWAALPINSPRLTEESAVQLHLDTLGQYTKGVCALRARQNPEPVDLGAKFARRAEDYFEPLKSDLEGKLTFKEGEHYLIASKEVLNIPPHLNAVLRAHADVGLRGRLHFAGFIDPGFIGDLVFEIIPTQDAEIDDGMAISDIVLFRTTTPDKVYGEVGSHYQFQKGPKTAKYFQGLDFDIAGKNVDALSRIVLVEDAKKFHDLRTYPEGLEPVHPETLPRLLELIEGNPFFHSRYDCEDDESVLQVIPYVVMFDQDKKVFSYVRAKDYKLYGDKRLFDKFSIALGGHIRIEDRSRDTEQPNFVLNNIRREVLEEEVRVSGQVTRPHLYGTMFIRDQPVDRVHFGLIYAIHVNGKITPREDSIAWWEMMSLNKLRGVLKDSEYNVETWTRTLIPQLDAIYAATKSSEYHDIGDMPGTIERTLPLDQISWLAPPSS
ncbi:MAG: 2'-deoxycytidine 5'-triphosphate deaminase [archaeon]